MQLQELHLQNNAIRAVAPWAFTGLRRLRVLDLSHNHLQTLYANTFASNRGLNTLILAGNNLARLPPDQPLPAAPRLQVGGSFQVRRRANDDRELADSSSPFPTNRRSWTWAAAGWRTWGHLSSLRCPRSPT